MLVTCPQCAKRYHLGDTALGEKGRQLRCASCSHIWFQSVPQEKPSTPPKPPSPPSETKKASLLPKLLAGGVLLGLGSGAYFFSAPLKKLSLPYIETIASAFGIETAPPWEGLTLEKTTTHLIEDKGKYSIVIRGVVKSGASSLRSIPPLKISLMTPCKTAPEKQCTLDQWTHTLSKNELLPGEELNFEIPPHAYPSGVTGVMVGF